MEEQPQVRQDEPAAEGHPWSGAADQLNEWNHGRTSMTEQTRRKRCTSLTERRNQIARYSDLANGSLTERKPVLDADITDANDWIEPIALPIASVVG